MSRILSLLPVLTLLGACVAVAAEHSSRAIRRSDVVFMYDNPDRYEAYGCTVMGWAGHADPKRIELAHSKGVRLYSCSVGLLTEFAGAIDFSPDFLDAACRDFEGKPYLVPWLWDHRHKGQPAYWWCSNSPLYRRYLDKRLADTMAAKPDGLHIDDYRSTSGSVTWLSGGFCRHCMAGFRDYLKTHASPEKLSRLGIVDLEHFDYREWLVAKGVTPDQYKKQRASLPLAAEFLDFHVRANTDFVAAYRKQGEELRGQPITLSVNSELGSPQALAIAPHLSYFCCEVGQQAARLQPPTHPVAIYKLADALGRPVAATASGQDWAFILEKKLPGLVRTWTALSYAFGQNFMAPHHQWAYTQAKGTHWYDGPTEEYAWLYQFVRANARLLDGYDAVAQVGVVYSNAAARKGRGGIEPVCAELASRNLPFAVAIAGDDWLPLASAPQSARPTAPSGGTAGQASRGTEEGGALRLSAEQLAGFKAVIVTDIADLDPEQKKLLDRVDAVGRLVRWPDLKHLAELVPPPITIEGSTHVWAIPRAIPGDPKAPAAVHLLNRAYDAGKDAMAVQPSLTLRLRRDLFGGRAFSKAVLHAPKAPPLPLEVATTSEGTSIRVPALDLWAIVELAP